jgi:hypothetical protein
LLPPSSFCPALRAAAFAAARNADQIASSGRDIFRIMGQYPNINYTRAKDAWEIMILALWEILA